MVIVLKYSLTQKLKYTLHSKTVKFKYKLLLFKSFFFIVP